MKRRTAKLIGRRVAGCYGRTTKKLKRIANKATRRYINTIKLFKDFKVT